MRYLIKSCYLETVKQKKERMTKNGWKAITDIKYITDDDPPYFVCVMEIEDSHPKIGGGTSFF